MSDGEPIDFTTFEAAAKEPAAPVEPDAEGIHDASLGEKAPESEGTLELTPEDQVGEDETDTDAEERRKSRSKPAHQRIAELVAKGHEKDRRIAELEGRAKAPEQPSTLERPDPANFEFGEADPAYLEAITDWKVEVKLAERDKAREAEQADNERIQTAAALDANWAEKAEKAVEKYPDFQEKVIETAAAGEWDLLPLSAAAVQGSEVADDIAYHLATNRDDAAKLANLERSFHAVREQALKAGVTPELANLFAKPYFDQAAELFESIEGKYKGGKPKAPSITKAPEPPQNRARGTGGRYEVDATTNDFAAFEAKVNGARR